MITKIIIVTPCRDGENPSNYIRFLLLPLIVAYIRTVCRDSSPTNTNYFKIWSPNFAQCFTLIRIWFRFSHGITRVSELTATFLFIIVCMIINRVGWQKLVDIFVAPPHRNSNYGDDVRHNWRWSEIVTADLLNGYQIKMTTRRRKSRQLVVFANMAGTFV